MQFLISPLAYTTASLHQRLQTTNAFKRLTLQHHQEKDRHHPPEGAVKGINIYNNGAAAEPLRRAE